MRNGRIVLGMVVLSWGLGSGLARAEGPSGNGERASETARAEDIVIVPSEPLPRAALDALERAVLDEMNLMRRDPRGYTNKLAALRERYRGRVIERPGRPGILTEEGVGAVDEAIGALAQAPRRLPRLAWTDGLARAAHDHARDLGARDALGHTGADGSGPDTRVQRHGAWQGLVAENISFGPTDAEDIVTGLIVDDGVASRGHREVLLTAELFFAGVGCGPHPSYGTVCVIDYATGFQTKGPNHKAGASNEAPRDALPGEALDDDGRPGLAMTTDEADEVALSPRTNDTDGTDDRTHTAAPPHVAMTTDAYDEYDEVPIPVEAQNAEEAGEAGETRETGNAPGSRREADPEIYGDSAAPVEAHEDSEPRHPAPSPRGVAPGPSTVTAPEDLALDITETTPGPFVIRYYHGPPSRQARMGAHRGHHHRAPPHARFRALAPRGYVVPR
jgi:uncharacterized protein YkwD